MLIKVSTEKSAKETAAAPETAVTANHFSVMQVHDLKESMAGKGVEFARECLIFDVCQPKQAKNVVWAGDQRPGCGPACFSDYQSIKKQKG